MYLMFFRWSIVRIYPKTLVRLSTSSLISRNLWEFTGEKGSLNATGCHSGPQRHFLRQNCVVWAITRQNRLTRSTCAWYYAVEKKHNNCNFTIIRKWNSWGKRLEFCRVARSHRRNHLCRYDPDQPWGFQSTRAWINVLSHWKRSSSIKHCTALTHCTCERTEDRIGWIKNKGAKNHDETYTPIRQYMKINKTSILQPYYLAENS